MLLFFLGNGPPRLSHFPSAPYKQAARQHGQFKEEEFCSLTPRDSYNRGYFR